MAVVVGRSTGSLGSIGERRREERNSLGNRSSARHLAGDIRRCGKCWPRLLLLHHCRRGWLYRRDADSPSLVESAGLLSRESGQELPPRIGRGHRGFDGHFERAYLQSMVTPQCCLTTRWSGPWGMVGRVCPRHGHRGRPLNWVVRWLSIRDQLLGAELPLSGSLHASSCSYLRGCNNQSTTCRRHSSG